MATPESQAKRQRKRSDYGFHQVHQTRWSVPGPLNGDPKTNQTPTLTNHTHRFDNDMYAHLNNAVYTHLFDTIANTANSRPTLQLPLPSNLAAGADQIGLIVSTHADFFASVRFPDLLEVGLRVNRLSKSSVTWEVGIFRKGEEDVKMVGTYTHVFVLRETMRVGKTGMEERTRQGLEKLLVRAEAKL
ncbi:Thioesterase superfamily [Penicillium expansum]|nr:Thioesterase superfamily [Penicillium expansum]